METQGYTWTNTQIQLIQSFCSSLQVIDSSAVGTQVLASLQPVTLQGGKILTMAGGDNATVQTISLAQLAQTAQQNASAVSLLALCPLISLFEHKFELLVYLWKVFLAHKADLASQVFSC